MSETSHTGTSGSEGGAERERGEPPVIDGEALAKLRLALGSRADETMRALVAKFVAQTTRLLGEARQGVELGEAQTLSRVAHVLKGSCAQMAATSMALAAQELERLATSGDLDEAGQVVDELQDTFVRVRAVLAPGHADQP